MDSLYDTYATTICKDIPIDYLKQFILGFLYEASKDMGVVLEKITMPDRVYDIISTHYNHLPLSLVASAFKRGALGQYGAGRLVPRTVFGWLGEMNQYFMTVKEHKEEKDNKTEKYNGLEKYPLGKAINKKIDWLASGAITEAQYDRIPLKGLAEMIGMGTYPTLEMFGIETEKELI